MKFYRAKMLCGRAVDDIITQKVLNENKKVNLSALVLELTAKFEVSNKTITQRVDLWLERLEGDLVLEEGVLKKAGVNNE